MGFDLYYPPLPSPDLEGRTSDSSLSESLSIDHNAHQDHSSERRQNYPKRLIRRKQYQYLLFKNKLIITCGLVLFILLVSTLLVLIFSCPPFYFFRTTISSSSCLPVKRFIGRSCSQSTKAPQATSEKPSTLKLVNLNLSGKEEESFADSQGYANTNLTLNAINFDLYHDNQTIKYLQVLENEKRLSQLFINDWKRMVLTDLRNEPHLTTNMRQTMTQENAFVNDNQILISEYDKIFNNKYLHVITSTYDTIAKVTQVLSPVHIDRLILDEKIILSPLIKSTTLKTLQENGEGNVMLIRIQELYKGVPEILGLKQMPYPISNIFPNVNGSKKEYDNINSSFNENHTTDLIFLADRSNTSCLLDNYPIFMNAKPFIIVGNFDVSINTIYVDCLSFKKNFFPQQKNLSSPLKDKNRFPEQENYPKSTHPPPLIPYRRDFEKLFYYSLGIDEWSEWSPCNAKCNRGLQFRQRKCGFNPLCDQETEERMCNTFPCKDSLDLLEGLLLKHFPRGVKKLQIRPTAFEITRYATLMTPTSNIIREPQKTQGFNLFLSFKSYPQNNGYLFTISSLKAKMQFGIRLGKETQIIYQKIESHKEKIMLNKINKNDDINNSSGSYKGSNPLSNDLRIKRTNTFPVRHLSAPIFYSRNIGNIQNATRKSFLANLRNKRDVRIYDPTLEEKEQTHEIQLENHIRISKNLINPNLANNNIPDKKSTPQLLQYISNDVVYIKPDPVWLAPLNDGRWHSLAIYMNASHLNVVVDCVQYAMFQLDSHDFTNSRLNFGGVTTLGSNFADFPSLRNRFEGILEHVLVSTTSKDLTNHQCSAKTVRKRSYYDQVIKTSMDIISDPQNNADINVSSASLLNDVEPISTNSHTLSMISSTLKVHRKEYINRNQNSNDWINQDDEDFNQVLGSGIMQTKSQYGSGHIPPPLFAPTNENLDLMTNSSDDGNDWCKKCLNGASCHIQNRCNCKKGYKGKFCEEPICELESEGHLRFSDCQNGGKCQAPNNCSCSPGFSGSFCQFSCPQKCLSSGGSCMNSDVCTCPDGHSLKATSCSPICEPECLNSGICIAPNQCHCPPSHTGPQCQLALAKIVLRTQNCDTNPCLNGGSCISLTKSPPISANDTGNGERTDVPFSYKSTARINESKQVCRCKFGFYGERCEKQRLCAMMPFREKYQKVYIVHVEDEALVPCKEWSVNGCHLDPRIKQISKQKTFFRVKYRCVPLNSRMFGNITR